MPDYDVEERNRESATVRERAGSAERRDDGSDQVFPGRSAVD